MIAKIEYADLLGKDFAYGGRGPDVYDCYGLAMEISRRAGIILPEWESVSKLALIHDEIEKGKSLFRELPGPKPFCLVVFVIQPPHESHIGVMLGDNRRFIHTLENLPVTVERLDSPMPPNWRKRATGFWEVKPDVR